MKRLLTLGSIAAVAALATLTAGAALGAESPRLTDAGARFPDRFYSLLLPQRQKLGAQDVTVTENGQPVSNLSVTPPGGQGAATILAIDASNSMRGAPIEDAMQAARAFAAKRRASSALGVVFFGKEATVALRPTRDADAINAVLASKPELTEGTRLYDAVGLAARELDAANANTGAVVLLTDGNDIGSVATAAVAISNSQAAGARIFAVGLKSDQFAPETLQTLASSTSGTYTEAADTTALTPIFDTLGFRLANEYLIFYRSLVKPKQDVDVVIRVQGYATPLRTSYTSPALDLSRGSIGESFWDKLVQSWAFMLLVAVAIVALLAYAVRLVVVARRSPARSRIQAYIDPDVESLAQQQADEDIFVRIKIAGRRFERQGPMQRFSELCDIGAVETRPSVLAVGSLGGGLVLAVLLSVAWAPWAFVFGVVPPLVTWMYVNTKVSRRRKQFGEQLPENLDVLAAALRAGHSLAGGFSVMANEAQEPSRTEFRRVVSDENLGLPLDESLDRVGDRMQNRDVDQLALVAQLARETGGSSAEVIDQVAANVRGRMEVRRLVRTLTAQGRLARWIVWFMPVFLVFAILVIFPTYLKPLFTTTVGLSAFIVAAVMVVAGSLVIKRIVEIKI